MYPDETFDDLLKRYKMERIPGFTIASHEKPHVAVRFTHEKYETAESIFSFLREAIPRCKDTFIVYPMKDNYDSIRNMVKNITSQKEKNAVFMYGV